ncbi:hypothetical protein DL96DRAFT_1818071 [Flagelloscypha sp. PMI_526]|nr:hypothetical protein DL96DRAFT_1818071 [Flagelloscypha sp. PMI_526]
MSQPEPVGDGLCCLSFDGGGLRVLCQALIVREMLARLRGDRRLAQPLKAADHFDIICGSGFGGLLAIMCGVLHMTGDELVEELVALCAAVFIPYIDTAERTAKLEGEIKRLIRKYSLDVEGGEERKMFCETATCKTFVCAAPSSNVSHPRLFRNYLSRSNAGPDCTVLEATRATMSVPGLFEPISIGSVHIREPFIAGELRWNNPMDILTREIKEVFNDRHVACVVSIGSGHPGHLSLSEGLADFFPRIAQDCERLADDMDRRFEYIPDVYRRLSVEQGLQNLAVDLSNFHEVVSHTHSYLQGPQISRHVDSLLVDLVQRPHRILAQEISGTIPRPSTVIHRRICPPPTEYFTGRDDHLHRLHKYYSTKTDSCHIGVLYGLGASGKTQIALKFIQQSLKRKRFTDVFFVDASDKMTLENDLKSIAAGNSPKPSADDALRLLGDRDDEWLLFLDNADDTTLDLHPYVRWSHGNVLVTTRNREVCAHAPKCGLQVGRLELKEAEDLLLVGVKLVQSDETMSLVHEIVQELGCLALAINQARAYLAKGLCSLSEYLHLYKQNRQMLLEDHSTQKTDEYAYSVYTTWAISFVRLSSHASFLFQLLCFMHHDGIPSNLFEDGYGALNEKVQEVVPSKLVEFLSHFSAADSKWNAFQFYQLIGEILSFSLIEFDPLNRTISIHPLVQQWAQESFHADNNIVLSTQALLSLAVPLGNEAENRARAGSMVVHFREALKRDVQLHHTLLHPIVESYIHSGAYREALPIARKDMDVKMRNLGSEHPDTVLCMNHLVTVLWLCQESIDSPKLGKQALDITKRIFGCEDPATLSSMSTLASIYSNLGQHREALELEEHLLEILNRNHGPEGPNTLVAMGNLVGSYSSLGMYRDAVKLGEEVVERTKRIFGPEAMYTLSYTSNLAQTYSDLGQFIDALNLREEVLKSRTRTLGAKHPLTFKSMQSLAESYSSQGRHTEALALKNSALTMRKQVIGHENPHTLDNMLSLANTYSDLGRHSDALQLKEETLELQKRILDQEHPSTLETQASLANTFSDLGQHTKALALKRHVLELREKKLGVEHPRTLTSMSDLAKTYLDLGHHRDTLELQERVVELRSRALGEQHPDTVKSRDAVEELLLAFAKVEQDPRGTLLKVVGVALLMAVVAYFVRLHWVE